MPGYKSIENLWNHPKLWADGSVVEEPKVSPQEWENIQRGIAQLAEETDEK